MSIYKNEAVYANGMLIHRGLIKLRLLLTNLRSLSSTSLSSVAQRVSYKKDFEWKEGM